MVATDTRLRAQVQSELAAVVGAAGLDLEGVELASAGRRRVLRVLVDCDGGVDLDAVAEVSRAISETLDTGEVMGATPYVLEVSSPGAERPLTAPRHWRRASGRLVRAELTDGSVLIARVRTAGETSVALEAPGGRRDLDYAQVRRARVQIEFAHQGEPGERDEVDATDETGG
ncbi:MAG: ribosome maturation factor RimP [Sporichthyaceae bacterium]